MWAETFNTAEEFAQFVNGGKFDIIQVIQFDGKLVLIYKY